MISKRSLDMDNKITSDELGELRCSNLEVPMLKSEIFNPVITSFIGFFTDDQWELLPAEKAKTDTVTLLTKMCHEIVDVISSLVLEAVGPQVQSRMHGQTALEGASISSNASIIMNMTPQRKYNYHSVTEEDIQASLGDSFHTCFGEALGGKQEMTYASEILTRLFAKEAKRRVNRSLAMIKQNDNNQTPSLQSMESAESETFNASVTKNMVRYIIHILMLLTTEYEHESTKYEEILDSGVSARSGPDTSTDVEELSVRNAEIIRSVLEKRISDLSGGQCIKRASSYVDGDFSARSGSDMLMNVEELCVKDAETIRSVLEKRRSDLSGGQTIRLSACCAEELPQRGNTFYTVFLWKLVDHIAHSTKTSILDVDFDGMLGRLRERTVGETSSNLPQSVGNLHIPIYEELCCELGSSKLLQAAMVSGDVAFEEAVARTLKAQLRKASRNTSSFVTKVKRFFGRNNKVAPACEINTLTSHTEVIILENGSESPMPPPPTRAEQKHPAIMRIFSTARILRKPFCSRSRDY